MWIVPRNWRNKQAEGTILGCCCWRGRERASNAERRGNERMAVTTPPSASSSSSSYPEVRQLWSSVRCQCFFFSQFCDVCALQIIHKRT
jgi:hypothetical protein